MLNGTWLPITAKLNGQELPAESLREMRLLLLDDSYTATVNGVRDHGTLKAAPSTTPPAMEITGKEGPNAGRRLLAIYHLDGDKLTICYDLQGTAHPVEFKAEAGSQHFLVSYRRMQRITGIGGIFFKAQDSAKLRNWYQEHLGIKTDDYGGGTFGTSFHWREYDNRDAAGSTVWSIFARESNYFDQPLMINYRVENLDAVLDELRAEGVWIDDKREDGEFGRFAWIKDAEGNRIELWQPPSGGMCP